MDNNDPILLICKSVIGIIICFSVSIFFFRTGANVLYIPFIVMVGFIFLICFSYNIYRLTKRNNYKNRESYYCKSHISNIHLKNNYISNKDSITTNSRSKNHPRRPINSNLNESKSPQITQDHKKLVSYAKKQVKAIYCSFCGEKVSNTTKYCPMCGNKIIEFNLSQN